MLRRWLQEIRGWLTSNAWVATPVAPRWESFVHDNRTVYCGAFGVYSARGQLLWQVRGCVVERASRPTDVYLWNPPPALREHTKGHCLQLLKPGSLWFRLHWARPAHDFDTSRAYVEQLLGEAVGNTGITASNSRSS